MMYFNRHYFRESMRQTRGTAILCLGLSLFLSCVPLLIEALDHISNPGNTYLVRVDEFSPYMPFICLAFPFMFANKLFGFMFKRGSSDFYHALPFKRECIFLSNLAAMACWFAVTLAITLLCTFLIYVVDPNTAIRGTILFYNFAVYLVMFLQATGGILIAYSIVGKKVIAMTMSFIVLYLPRIIFLATTGALQRYAPMFISDDVFFFSAKYNILFSMTAGRIIEFQGISETFAFVPGLIVSLITAIVYLCVGCFLFTVRRSETAENAAPSHLADMIMQIAYSLVFFLTATVIVFAFDYETEIAIVLVIFGLGVFITFEAISTKRFKSIIKSLPRLGIILGICVVYYFALCGLGNHLLNKTYTGDRIKSVRRYYGNWYSNRFETGYTELKQRDVVYTEQEIRNLVAAGYAEYCKEVKKNSDSYEDGRNMIAVEIKLKHGGTKTRVIMLKDDDYKKLKELMQENADFKKAQFELPKDGYAECLKEAKHSRAVWESFKKEFQKLSDEEKLAITSRNDEREDYSYDSYYYRNKHKYSDTEVESTLTVKGYYGLQIYNQSYPIIKEFMPETAELYRKLLYEENIENFRTFRGFIENGAGADGQGYLCVEPVEEGDFNELYNANAYIYLGETGIYSSNLTFESAETPKSLYLDADEAKNFYRRLFECIDLDSVDPGENCVRLTIDYNQYGNYSSYTEINGSMVVGADVDKLRELLFEMEAEASSDGYYYY